MKSDNALERKERRSIPWCSPAIGQEANSRLVTVQAGDHARGHGAHTFCGQCLGRSPQAQGQHRAKQGPATVEAEDNQLPEHSKGQRQPASEMKELPELIEISVRQPDIEGE